MSGNYFLEKRRRDKRRLLKRFHRNPNMDEDRIAALFSMDTGYRIETVKRMVEELREAGLIPQFS